MKYHVLITLFIPGVLTATEVLEAAESFLFTFTEAEDLGVFYTECGDDLRVHGTTEAKCEVHIRDRASLSQGRE